MALDAARERDRLNRRLQESEAERAALSKALSDAEAAFHAGRDAVAAEVDRLRLFAVDAVRTRDEALRRLRAAQRAQASAANGVHSGSAAGGPHGSETTRKARLWLDGVLSQVSSLEVASDHEKSELIDRLRTVQAALSETSAFQGELLPGQPRPRNQDFEDPEQFRAALIGWLSEARQRRRGEAVRAGRMKSEIKSARNELALLDRDLVLSELGNDEAFAFPFDENESS